MVGHGRRVARVLGCEPLALALVLALGWPAPAHATVWPRSMGLYPQSGGPALAMLDSRVELMVRGPIVEAVVVQRFRNTGDRATEATYIFPLPADAAVSGLAIQIGSRTIRAAIETREAARRRYKAAVTAGVAGALLEQERPDVFTQNVSAIPPGGVVAVTLRYDAVARHVAGGWELVVPMVVAPRYVPGAASGRATTGSGRAPDTDRAPDASRITPAGAPGAGGATAIAIRFVDPPAEVVSPTHQVAGARGEVTLVDPHSDHDAIVRWRAAAPSAGWIERDDGGGFAAVMVEAPAAVSPHRRPLRVIVMIDRAATMRGDADAVARPVVRALCGALGAADRVRVIGSATLDFRPPGDALAALERGWATPGPVFDLTSVLGSARADGAAIVLVSAGLVADDAAAVAQARRLGAAIHVVGTGPAPARAMLHELAAVTGGTERYAVAGDDLGELARAVVADLASPPVPLTVHWGALDASEVEPAVLPRLGAGQAALVLARIRRVEAANARSRGQLFAFAVLGAPRAVVGATTVHGPLARRWARERLADLVARGADRDTVVRHALRYGLVSPYTSLVAIGSDVVVSGGVRHSVAVPVSVPSGMQWPAVQQVTEVAIGDDAAIAGAPVTPSAPAREAPPSSDDGRSPAEVASGSPASPPASAGDALRALSEPEGREESMPAEQRAFRLALALGGGVALHDGARGAVALTARAEARLRVLIGGELALWLVGGTHVQGRSLVTVGYDVGRWLEVGAGVGLHAGSDSGAAAALRLGVATPVPWLAGYLRYDAVLLMTRPSLAAQHAITLGATLWY